MVSRDSRSEGDGVVIGSVQDERTNAMVYQNREQVSGGDRRYKYVIFTQLTLRDRQIARNKFPNNVAWIPAEEYMYPVKKDGHLANASRHISRDRAQELYDLYQVRQVMES